MKYFVLNYLSLFIFHVLLSSCTQQGSAIVDSSVLESRIDSIVSQFQVIEKIEEPTYLEFDGGTILYVQQDAFLDVNGNPVNENVKIEMKEVQSMEEFLDGRISTKSNGQLLATSGSYYINATTGQGDPLKVNTEVGLNVSFPTLTKDSEVELFTGRLTESGDIDWIPAKRKETKMPLKIPKPPSNFVNMDDKLDLLQAKYLLEDIEKNYTKAGGFYVHNTAPEGNMKWNAQYIDDVKTWYRYRDKKLALYARLEKKYARAKQKYMKKMKKWIAHYGADQINSHTEIKSYEYYIDQMGWFNCDKFVNEELIAYQGKIEGANSKIRVHLLSQQEMVHVTKVSDDNGAFTFEFPNDKPFEIYAVGADASVRKQFDGSVTNLDGLLLVK